MSKPRRDECDPLFYACDRCGAAAEEPCVTVRNRFDGPLRSYRGQGVRATHVHNARLLLATSAERLRHKCPTTLGWEMTPERAEVFARLGRAVLAVDGTTDAKESS